MAYDPEARQTSNMALVIGIIVLVLIVGGAIAYMTSRPSGVETAPPTIVHDQAPAPSPQVVPVPVPVPNNAPAPNVTINPPTTHSSTTTTTTIEKKEAAPAADAIPKSDSGTIDTGKSSNQSAPKSSDSGKSSTSSTTTTTTSPSGY